MNTQVGRIARQQARLGGFTPFPEALVDEDDAISSSDGEMTTFQ